MLHQNENQRSNGNKNSLHIDPQMEASMSFGCYSVEGSVSHCRRVEETVQLCSKGGAQSVLIDLLIKRKKKPAYIYNALAVLQNLVVVVVAVL